MFNKTNCFLALVLLLIFSRNLNAQGTNPGTANLTHSWTFNDGTPNDYVGGANGTLMGGAKVVDGSLMTSSSSQYMKMPAGQIAINNYHEVTIEAWFISVPYGNTGYHMLAYFGNTVNSVGNDYFFITPARGDDKSRAAISCGVESSPWTGETGADGPELDDGELHHMVSTLDSTKVTLYIDGELQGSTPLAANNSITLISPTFAYLAKSGYDGDSTWAGQILEFNMYNRALSADEVLFLFNKGAIATGVSEGTTTTPHEFDLLQNYPNPFNPATKISFNLPVSSNIRLLLIDMLGNVVKEISSGSYSAGNHEVTLNASNLSSGVYFYKLEAGNFVGVKKLVLMK